MSNHVIAHIEARPGGIEIIALCGARKLSDGVSYDNFVPVPLFGGGCSSCWHSWLTGYLDTMRKARTHMLEVDELEARAEDVDRQRRAEEAARRLDGTHGEEVSTTAR